MIVTNVIAELCSIVGEDYLRVGSDISPRNCADAAEIPPVVPRAVVLPGDTQEVSQVLHFCQLVHQPLVIQGGMTGLAGGAQPMAGEVALSLERLNGVEDVDIASRTMIVRAGTPLFAVHEAAEAAGLFYGVDLGARGSCTIGGNVATNAGGIHVMRYGMTRRNVLGLEAVLAGGTTVTCLNRMLKNNAGYDWTQLLIGSEGTLGVVTRVSLALQERPAGPQTALCACVSVDSALATLRTLDRRFPGRLIAFEAMWKEYIDLASRMDGLPKPFAGSPEITVLVETALGEDDWAREVFAEALAELLDAGLIEDAVIAQSLHDRKRFWDYREANYEFDRFMPKGQHFDVSLPLDRMDEAIETLRRALHRNRPDATLVVFGHLADCNLHLAVYPPDDDDLAEVVSIVYRTVATFGASVSAEHGIGVLKLPYLELSRSAAELDLMRLLKRTLDPANILNPGRVLTTVQIEPRRNWVVDC